MLRRIALHFFLLLVTVAIFGYVFLLTTAEDDMVEDMYQLLPGVQYIGVTLGLYDTTHQYDPDYTIKQAISQRLERLASRQKAGKDETSPYRLKLEEDISYKKLYSPVYRLAGSVSDLGERVEIVYTHQGRELRKILPVELGVLAANQWEIELSLAHENMFRGINEYAIVVYFADGEQVTRSMEIEVEYDRIELGDTVLYLDPHYVAPGSREDILREAEDFEGISTNFLTYGCDPDISRPRVLIEQAYQYTTLPACLSFSVMKRYLVAFEFSQLQDQTYFYDVLLPDGQVLMNDYPLYIEELGNVYMSLVFWDQQESLLKSLRITGDLIKYIMTVERYNIADEALTFRMIHSDGHNLVVETPREKIYIYMYKEWDNYYSLTHPGMRYQYFIKSWADYRTKINEGSLAVSKVGVVSPRQARGATFDFDVSLQDGYLFVDDGVHVVQFAIDDIGGTLDAVEKQYLINQPRVCDNIEIDIYEDMDGQPAEAVRLWDKAYIVAKGVLSSQVHIHHNGSTSAIEPDWFYKGYLQHEISRASDNLEAGKNIYTIVLSDSRGNELCRTNVSLETRL